MLDLFRELISAEKCSLVFTTSQIMDVETCADYVAYLRRGELIAYTSVDEFSRSFLLVKGRLRFLTDELESALHGIRVTEKGFTGMIKTKDEAFTTGCQIKEPRLEQIMVFWERPESRPRRAHEEAE
jgi:ABC-2 type transport system ATP-binding protein